MSGAIQHGSERPPPTEEPEAPVRQADVRARIAAAQAVGRLSHGLVGRRAPASLLRQVVARVDELVRDLDAAPPRRGLDDMLASPRLAPAFELTGRAIQSDGASIDLLEHSFVSGRSSPFAIGLRICREADEAVGVVTLGNGWEGAPGRAHGGVVAACVDETFGGLLPILGVMAFTGELTVRYRAPCPLGVPLEFRAGLVGTDGPRKLLLSCRGVSPAGCFVEASSVFVTVDPLQFASGR